MRDTTLLVGLDIYDYVKGIVYTFSHMGETPDMTEREAQAYRSGVNITLSLLDQAINEMFTGVDNELLVHVPGLKDAEEFYSVEEIMERLAEV